MLQKPSLPTEFTKFNSKTPAILTGMLGWSGMAFHEGMPTVRLLLIRGNSILLTRSSNGRNWTFPEERVEYGETVVLPLYRLLGREAGLHVIIPNLGRRQEVGAIKSLGSHIEASEPGLLQSDPAKPKHVITVAMRHWVSSHDESDRPRMFVDGPKDLRRLLAGKYSSIAPAIDQAHHLGMLNWSCEKASDDLLAAAAA